MSEYQYYEFQAVDRPLSEADRRALRDRSTRAKITATSFTNSYDWGDFKGDPAEFMKRWFDLHLYLANWGSRRLMIRLPTRLVDRRLLKPFLDRVDCAELKVVGENLIFDIRRDEIESENWDDGTSWLAALAPLRADVLAGDLRLFYLVWLMAVEDDLFAADEPEPMSGIGPMTEPLEAFARFFDIDPDLAEAAAACPAVASTISQDAARRAIAGMANNEKTGLLMRLFEGDPHLTAELRGEVRARLRSEGGPPTARRTVGELQARAGAIRLARERAEADRSAAKRKREADKAEKIRQVRLGAIARRGESIWHEIETEIERRNPVGYDKAADLLLDLKAIAAEHGTMEDFLGRLRSIRERHIRKERFIERLAAIG